jgi:hypothetical protein
VPIISSRTVGLYAPRYADYLSAALSPSDSTDLPVTPGQVCAGLYVGGAGNVSATTLGGVAVTFTAVPAGTILDASLRRVLSTGTTATAIQALYRPSER